MMGTTRIEETSPPRLSVVRVWQRNGYPLVKRILDVVGGTLALALALPMLAVVAIWIKYDSPGPVLFRQVRVGRDGKRFTMYKFRSMRSDADETIHREYFLQLLKAQQADQGTTVFKVPRDPRVTRAGAILRKTSLDELPNLFNVLRGEMSLVGPRPAIPYEVDAYDPWMRRRLEVRPGITGLWQVRGRSRLSVEQMLQLDVEYVHRQSLLLDLTILLLTLPTVLAPGKAA
jgi:lipopolysaccharide/colanic/teichoic acid biosynthesis glycosyltransferase